MQVSLIVTTYNWKEALALALDSIKPQSRLPDEVIVADDGSRADTAELIHAFARDFPTRLSHVWQEDNGFRLARSRNRAIAASRGDYLIVIDGDMLLHRDFVADHLALAQPGIFLQGLRLNATPAETARLLAGGAPRFSPLMPGEFRRKHALRLRWLARRKIAGRQGGGQVMGCNQSYWREDLMRVNGFDERMQSWGREDDEAAARLDHTGIHGRPLRYAALAIHLYHRLRWPEGHDPATGLPNDPILRETLTTRAVRCSQGIDSHRDEFATPPADLRARAADMIDAS
ncbi:MAG: glycosyltransferase family 2 protein [Dokdonella sp.]